MDESLFKKKSIIVSKNPKLNNETFRVSIEYFFLGGIPLSSSFRSIIAFNDFTLLYARAWVALLKVAVASSGRRRRRRR